MAIQYANLSSLHKTRGNLGLAEAFYEKSLALYQAIGAKIMIAKVSGRLRQVRELQSQKGPVTASPKGTP